MKSFENKTVLITGGNSGIGEAAVLAFAKEGANVVISGRPIGRIGTPEEIASASKNAESDLKVSYPVAIEG
jgi:NADP-dependent 3-hydroxy acid dehydrogenase YdfG